jgi:hypothetical protein
MAGSIPAIWRRLDAFYVNATTDFTRLLQLPYNPVAARFHGSIQTEMSEGPVTGQQLNYANGSSATPLLYETIGACSQALR